jgi:dihydroflavonol-4-reductase
MSDYWIGKRVCVTGGSGFLGYHLVKLLRQAGARLRVLCLPPSPNHPLRGMQDAELLFGDLLDAALTKRAVADCDVVFHTAGIVAMWGSGLRRMDAVNVEGTRLVLNASRGRIVHTSSIVTVGAGKKGEVFEEDSTFNLEGVGIDYVRTKRAAEDIALARTDRDVVVVNPGYLIGPEDYENSTMTRLFSRFWRGRMPVLPPGGYSLADVRDVARGHLLAAEKGQSARRYILAGENVAWPQLAEHLAAAAGLPSCWTPSLPAWALRALAGFGERRAQWTKREPYPSIQQARLQRFRWFYDSSRARSELGYRTRPVKDSIDDMFRSSHVCHPVRLNGLQRWFFPTRGLRRAADSNLSSSPMLQCLRAD